MGKLGFSWHPGAKIRCERPPGAATAQPYHPWFEFYVSFVSILLSFIKGLESVCITCFATKKLNSFLAFLSSCGDLLCGVPLFPCLSIVYCHLRKLACIEDVI